MSRLLKVKPPGLDVAAFEEAPNVNTELVEVEDTDEDGKKEKVEDAVVVVAAAVEFPNANTTVVVGILVSSLLTVGCNPVDILGISLAFELVTEAKFELLLLKLKVDVVVVVKATGAEDTLVLEESGFSPNFRRGAVVVEGNENADDRD